MGKLSYSQVILTALLLLMVTSPSIQQDSSIRVLPDIVFQEGKPAGEEIISIQDNYTSSFDVFYDIQGVQEPTVFEMYFSISDDTRTIYTNRIISRDDMALALQKPHSPLSFVLTFYVVDIVTTVDMFRVTIRVTDIDNNRPVFVGYENRPFPLLISEGSTGIMSGIPLATDNDEGINTIQNYTLVDTIDGLFGLELRTDEEGFINDIRLVLNSVLDRETRAQYSLSVVATEGNQNPDSATLMVNITVEDVCDEPPRFPVSRHFPLIEENSPEGTTIFSNITASDLDIRDTISYRISEVCSYKFQDTPPCVPIADSNVPFNLDPETGALITNQALDREVFAQYEITILAVDNCGSTATMTVVVTIMNENDYAPSVSTTVGVSSGTSIGFSVYYLLGLLYIAVVLYTF